MADEFASRTDNKRKYEEPSAASVGAAPRRPSGFSAPVESTSPDPSARSITTPSYNSVPPPAEGIELAKQRAQEIAARIFSDAEAKRPRVENGAGADDHVEKGFGSVGTEHYHKPQGQQVASSQVAFTPPASFPSYGYTGASKKIDIPNGRVGVIIGKGGETIKNLQLQSGAKIQVTRDMDADPHSDTRIVELMGTSEQISRAEQLINEVISEAEAGGSGLLASRRFVGGQAGMEQFVMKVPNNKVGLVIGKGGENIKNMQAKSGARIQVIPLRLPPGDTSTERTVQIDGTNEQIESAKQLVNEVISDNRPGNPQMGGYPQQGYRPPRPQASWGPPGPPPMQQPGYGYMQPGAYAGAPPQYSSSQPPYGGYPPPPTSTGYASGWEQNNNTPSQHAAPGSGYDYYSQQQQQPPLGGSSAPSDAPNYNYGQPPNYNPQGSYGETAYSQQPVGQQPSHGQDGYSGYQAPPNQAGYTQSGYDQQQGYSSAPYGAMTNSNPDGSASTYGAQGGPTQAPPAQQGPPGQSPATQQAYTGQQPSTAPPAYSSQGTQSGYGMPPTSQAGYGGQLPNQMGYGQPAPLNPPAYGQPPSGQKPPTTSTVYGQGQPPTAQAGYAQPGPVQPGYGSSQPLAAQSGYGSGAPQQSYGQQQSYGSTGAPSQGQAGYVQQQPYGDSYGSGGYAQPHAYASENASGGSAHGSTTPQAVPSGVTKASPQAQS